MQTYLGCKPIRCRPAFLLYSNFFCNLIGDRNTRNKLTFLREQSERSVPFVIKARGSADVPHHNPNGIQMDQNELYYLHV